jgi:phage tail sheath protein FI/predicted transcriptional regulator
MVQVSYPGVYIQEVSSGVHTITSVATSITAFIDFFREGPMNKAVEIFGMADFQRVFGGLDDRSEASYAIAQYFLNGGGTALVIRAARLDGTDLAKRAGAILKADAGVAAAEVLEVQAYSEGAWGNNLRVDVDYNVDSSSLDAANLFNLTVTRYDGPTAKAKPLGSERFLNLTMDDTKPRYALRVINDSSRLIEVKKGGATSTNRPAATGTISGDLSGLKEPDFNALSGQKISVQIGTQGPFNATLETWAAGKVTSLTQLRPKLEKAIRDAKSDSASFTGATVDVEGPRLRVASGKGSTTFEPVETVVITDALGDTTASAKLLLATPANTNANVQQYPLGLSADHAALKKTTIGSDGVPPDAKAIVGNPVDFSGLYALEKVDLFNILCIPRAGTKNFPDGNIRTVYNAALAFCERKRAFVLIDSPPDKDEVQEIKDWLDDHGEFRKKNAALYFPRTQIPDPVNEFRPRSVATSGTMAGIYARTDNERGVWKAPAGIEAVLDGVTRLDTKLTDTENGVLNPLAINCLRTFPVYGGIAWGARTLVGADVMGSEWKYVPIRRLALMLEESLFRGTKWVVFEPNDEPLWANIRLNVGAYMNSLFRQGAFQGATPKEAYFVKCDGETTNQDDRNKGIVNILVGFAPLKPAEFVVISIQQIAGDL